MLEKQTYLQYLQTAYNVTALVEKNKGNNININVNIDLAKNITQLDNPYLYLLGRENLAAQLKQYSSKILFILFLIIKQKHR